jgi:hypothetical protein
MSVDGQSRYEVGMRLKDKIAIVVGAGWNAMFHVISFWFQSAL